MIEFLESRQLLSATLLNGVLTVNGTPGADVMFTRIIGRNVVASVNGVDAKFAAAHVSRIVLNGGSGDDFLTNGTGTIRGVLNGGNGNDILSGGMGNDTLNGGNGDDRCYGQGGNDWIDGGFGDDSLVGGDGTDTVSYATRTHAVTVDLATGTGGEKNEHDLISSIENIVSGAGDDVLTGDDNANVIGSGGGNDSISGGGGADRLLGGIGNDTFFDVDESQDRLDGGQGQDTATVNTADDTTTNMENVSDGMEALAHSRRA